MMPSNEVECVNGVCKGRGLVFLIVHSIHGVKSVKHARICKSNQQWAFTAVHVVDFVECKFTASTTGVKQIGLVVCGKRVDALYGVPSPIIFAFGHAETADAPTLPPARDVGAHQFGWLSVGHNVVYAYGAALERIPRLAYRLNTKPTARASKMGGYGTVKLGGNVVVRLIENKTCHFVPAFIQAV
jgi:hypothetical protein